MTPDLQKLRALAMAATPGEWRPSCGNGVASVLAGDCAVYQTVDRWNNMQASHPRWYRDAAFIAAANPQTILVLLDRIDELEANAVRMREHRFALEGIATDGKGNPLP